MTKAASIWNEGPSGMLTNIDELSGGIIDSRIVDGRWFVVFNNDALSCDDDFSTRAEAIDAAAEILGSPLCLSRGVNV